MIKTYYKSIDETLYKTKLNNGMELLVIPKAGFQKSYVTMTAKYGSIHQHFIHSDSKEPFDMPEGIAHFLEHKMFEKEDGDMFNLFSKFGGNANAFTSYDRTSYLFTTVESLRENIDLLIKMLQEPYFSRESVEKEVGIIAEEIKMYQDQPNYKLYYQTLNCLYHNHPVKTDIAGTIESINEITSETLYDCYNMFYHPENMLMFIVGDVDPVEITDYINKKIKIFPEYKAPLLQEIKEPEDVYERSIITKADIQKPKLMLGIKSNAHKDAVHLMKTELCVLFALDLLFGEQTDFYQSLLKDELIDETFGFNFTIEPSFSHVFIAGSTDDPDQLKARVIEQLQNIDVLQDEKLFKLLVKQTIGEILSSMNSPEYIANQFTKYYFNDAIMFDMLPILEELTLEEVIDVYKASVNIDNLVDSRMING